METVYTFLLHDLLSPLSGLADVDEEVTRYRTLDPNDPSRVKQVINDMLLPYFNGLGNSKRQLAKLCLRYYLSRPDSAFKNVFDSLLLPFDHPANPRDFFLWLWAVFFGDEDYTLEHCEAYPVDDSIDVTYRSFT